MPLSLENLQEEDIAKLVSKKLLNKGREQIHRVVNPVRQGQILQATVQGSRPYEVETEIRPREILTACGCLNQWDIFCEHVVAVLLSWLQAPQSFAILETAVPATLPPESMPATAVSTTQPRWLTESMADRHQKDRAQFHEWLSTYTVQDLRDIATEQNWTLSGTRKDALIAQLIQHLLQPSDLQQKFSSLDREHQQVFQALALLNPFGIFTTEQVTPLAKLWGPLKRYKKLESYLKQLRDKGLVLPRLSAYWDTVEIVPNDVMRVLPAVLENHLPSVPFLPTKTNEIRLADPFELLRVVNQITLLLEQSTPPLRPPAPRLRLEKFYRYLQGWDYLPAEIESAQQRNKLSQRAALVNLTVPPPSPMLMDETIASLRPVVGSSAKINFLYHLLLQSGLLRPGSPVMIAQAVKEAFLKQEPAKQWTILAQEYLHLTTWSELWLVLEGQSKLEVKRNSIPVAEAQVQKMQEKLWQFRQQVLRVLACLPDNVWLSFSFLCGILHPIWPVFSHAAWEPASYGRDVEPLWFLTLNGRSLATETNQAEWDMVQGAFIQQMLVGPLSWLGLVDLCLEKEQLIAFRLHGVADLFWDRVSVLSMPNREETLAPKAIPATAVATHADTITIDPQAMNPQAHAMLQTIATLVQSHVGQYQYRLSAEAVYQSFKNGHTLNDLLHDWRKHLSIPIPKAIQTQLTVWWENYGQIYLYENVTIIEFGDAYALTEMKAITSLEKHIIAEISPRMVLIANQAVESLVAELQKAGYTPKQTNQAYES